MTINPQYVSSLPLSFLPSFSLCLFFFYLCVALFPIFIPSTLPFFCSPFIPPFFIYLSLSCIVQKYFEVVHKLQCNHCTRINSLPSPMTGFVWIRLAVKLFTDNCLVFQSSMISLLLH